MMKCKKNINIIDKLKSEIFNESFKFYTKS